MSWNYRVMVKDEKDGSKSYGLHEVFYVNGHVDGWTTDAMAPFGETMKELRLDFALMARAFNKPILSHKTGKIARAGAGGKA